MRVSRAFVLSNGKISKPAVVSNVGSNALVKRTLEGGKKTTASGRRVVVPKSGRKRVPDVPSYVIKSKTGYWKFKKGRRLRGGGKRRTDYNGTVIIGT